MSPQLRRFVYAVLFLFVLLIGMLNLGSSRNSSWQSAPNSEYAVGFDLTESYGTVSIRDRSSSLQHVARVDGDKNYRSTMQRLSLESSRHSSPPYEWWHDGGALAGIDDFPRQMLRRFRKSIGLPASADVGAIANLLSSIRSAAERLSEKKITHAMISSPNLAALYDEDIMDAASHIGLILLLDSYFERQPKHLYAGFSAYGLNDGIAPETPDNEISTRAVLSVHLTKNALEVDATVKDTNRTCALDWAQRPSYMDHTLGFDIDKPQLNPPTLPWQKRVAALVQDCIVFEIQSYSSYISGNNITDILLLGERAFLAEFRQTVWDAVMELQVQEPVLHVGGAQGVEYMASRGAAEMAWEVLYPHAPRGNSSYAGECWGENQRKYRNGIRYSSGRLSQGVNSLKRPEVLETKSQSPSEVGNVDVPDELEVEL